jgi:hypothetical protein
MHQGVMVVNLKYNCLYDLLWDSVEHVVATEQMHIVAAPRREKFVIMIIWINCRRNRKTNVKINRKKSIGTSILSEQNRQVCALWKRVEQTFTALVQVTFRVHTIDRLPA